MDSRKSIILVAVTVAILLASGGVASAQSCIPDPRSGAAAWLPANGEFKPQAWDDTLVYSRWDSGAFVVMARDVQTGETVPVSPSTNRQWDPDINGELIVWEDDSGPDSDIVVYDLTVGTERRIRRTGSQRSPAIWGDTLVHEETLGLRTHLVVHDLSTGESRRLAVGPLLAPQPDIFENRVVYSAGGNIHLYDLESDTDRIVASSRGWQQTPSIFGDTIVFAQWDVASGRGDGTEGRLADIWRHDLSTGTNELVVRDVGTQYAPCVWPGGIAYEDYPVVGGASVVTAPLVRPIADAGSLSGTKRGPWSVTELRELAMRSRPRPTVPVLGRGYVHVCEPHAAPTGRWALAAPSG